MKTIRLSLLSTMVFVTVAVPLRAQVQIQQQVEVLNDELPLPGPAGRPQRVGTGRIRGRVISAESGSPVRRAQVRISGGDVTPRTALTDASGRYEFGDLPDGRFTLSASKPGYVNVQYGQTRPFESGKPIELADKQTLDRADIAIPRGSVIVGRIVDETGDPIADALVTAMRQQWIDGRRRLMNAGRTAQTNDLGQFRLYGLPPGDYYVSATVRNNDNPPLDWLAGGAIAAPVRASSPASGYAPTYYPGTPSVADAQRVTVGIGQEAQGTDFALIPVRLARITGIVLSSEGRPVEGAMVSAVPRSGFEMVQMFGGGARTTREGSFTLSNVAPGDYTLQVRSLNIVTSGNGDNMFVATRFQSGSDSEGAALPVTVSGEDLSNVVITTSKGATASGKVTFEGGRPPSATNVRVTSMADEGETPLLDARGGLGASLKPDGTFELKGLTGSRRLFRVAGLPDGWTLKSVEANGIDVADTGVEIKGSDPITGIEIVVSSKSTEVAGGVSGGDGGGVKDYTLVIFAEDSQKWTVPGTRWVTGTRPDQDGRFRVRNMPPGSYYAIAVDYLPRGEWNDPDVLERLKPKAQRFSLGEGETKTLDLKIAGGV
jgi:Carboxypeptidase regulatory-like domain